MAVATALAIIGAGVAIYQGVESNNQAKKQRRLIDKETRDAAEQRQYEVDRFAEEQQKAYIDSGVLLKGSPLLVLKETRSRGALDIQNMRDSGRSRADAVARQGRSALFQGFTSAAGYGINAYSAYDKPRAMSTSSRPDATYVGGFNDNYTNYGGRT